MTRRARASATTRERVLDAALRIFAENGFTGATTKEIARKAKVNEVTVFRLFKSKSALFAAVVSELSPPTAIQNPVDESLSAPVDEMLYGHARTVLRTLRENKGLYLIMMNDAWRQSRTRRLAFDIAIGQGVDFVKAMMARLMDDGRIRKMDPETIARAWMGAIQFYFLTTDVFGDGTPRPEEEGRMIRGFVSTFLDGVRAEQGGGQR